MAPDEPTPEPGAARRGPPLVPVLLGVLGVVVLLFVGWTLWGTSLTAARAQSDLGSAFDEAEAAALEAEAPADDVAGVPTESVSDIPPEERATRAPLPPYPEVGGLVARMEIPAIGLDWYVSEGVSLDVLRDINTDVHRGDVISIIGPSGTGKSTLLRALNMLEPPTSGEIKVDTTMN